jgi:hypothetical protein
MGVIDFCRKERKYAAWHRKPKNAVVGYKSGISMTTSGFTAVIKIRNGNPFILVVHSERMSSSRDGVNLFRSWCASMVSRQLHGAST